MNRSESTRLIWLDAWESVAVVAERRLRSRRSLWSREARCGCDDYEFDARNCGVRYYSLPVVAGSDWPDD
jgi:hypothetical protein